MILRAVYIFKWFSIALLVFEGGNGPSLLPLGILDDLGPRNLGGPDPQHPQHDRNWTFLTRPPSLSLKNPLISPYFFCGLALGGEYL